MTPMSDVDHTEENSPPGWMSEDKYRRLRGGISERAARRERQLGLAPPHVRWGHLIIYSEEGFEAELKARTQNPRRLGRPLGGKMAAPAVTGNCRKRSRPEVAERRERVVAPDASPSAESTESA
jgi:hypothetical protein